MIVRPTVREWPFCARHPPPIGPLSHPKRWSSHFSSHLASVSSCMCCMSLGTHVPLVYNRGSRPRGGPGPFPHGGAGGGRGASSAPSSLESAPGRPRLLPRRPQMPPGGPQDVPRGLQDAQDGPKTAQVGPQDAPRAFKMPPKSGPRGQNR